MFVLIHSLYQKRHLEYFIPVNLLDVKSVKPDKVTRRNSNKFRRV